jgi:hypothetical protein
MAFDFGDSFDLYGSTSDILNGYWDSAGSTVNWTQFTTGRYGAPGLAIKNVGVVSGTLLNKSSGVNDQVHHIILSMQTFGLTGSTAVTTVTLYDGATAQCTIAWRCDGAILLQAGAGGTTLATWLGALQATSTWYGFECEVVIGASGSFAIRKNGNTVNDFSITGINTQQSANAYANKVALNVNCAGGAQEQDVDDFYWRSGSSAIAGIWLGDIRCYVRMPATDVSVQLQRFPATITQNLNGAFTTVAIVAGRPQYGTFTAPYTATVGSVVISLGAANTGGNMKCSIFANAAGLPGAVVASATVVAGAITGSNTFTFTSPPTLTQGTAYWLGFCSDTSAGSFNVDLGAAGQLGTTTTYAAFPTANPPLAGGVNPFVFAVIYTISLNNSLVNEAHEDGATTYVYSSNPGDTDFYGIATLGVTPPYVVAVTTRGYFQKSDTNPRTGVVQLKSGGTTVASSAPTLSSTAWVWAWRHDVNDPNTGAAWTPTAVNNVQIGPKVIS